MDKVGTQAHTSCVRSTYVPRIGRALRWLLACCLVLGAWPAGAQALKHKAYHTVTRWNMDDGLPHNLVHAVAHGEDGLI
ncbi:hypothetical protein KW5_0119280 [Xanthomonas vasicola pv. vasculorum NCPPB 1326]|nr:hypothetical protein KW5_0119280 [Xanthomonas vasicola pv. vasculorum NCPPB 1326]